MQILTPFRDVAVHVEQPQSLGLSNATERPPDAVVVSIAYPCAYGWRAPDCLRSPIESARQPCRRIHSSSDGKRYPYGFGNPEKL